MIPDDRTADRSGELDFVALWRVFWGYKLLIAIITAVFVAGAVAIALTATPIYRAEVSVTEVTDKQGGTAGALASQLGGLASLVGVSLGSGGGSSQEAQAMLRSRYLIEEFVKRNKLMPVLYAKAEKTPTLWFGVRHFKNNVLTIRDDKRAGVTIIAVNWTDPEVAATWANSFIGLANDVLRTRAMSESKRSIAYLDDQIAKTTEVELRKVLYNLVQNETKTLMLANARSEYAFSVVDPAVAPEVRNSPKRTLLVLFGFALGLFVGTVTAFVVNMARNSRSVAQHSLA